MAFATVDDLSKRWPSLSPGDHDRATTLLEDASLLIEAEYRRAGIVIDPEDEFSVSARKIVCCSIVKRVMASSVDGDYTQMSQTAGSFTEQFTFANPSGDMYLTAREYKMLGIPQNNTKICQINLKLSDANEG